MSEADLPEHHYVEALGNGAYVQIDVLDPEQYVERYDGADPSTIRMREHHARAYVHQLRQQVAQRAAQEPTWQDFEGFAVQAMGREGGVGLLMRWAAENPSVKAA